MSADGEVHTTSIVYRFMQLTKGVYIFKKMDAAITYMMQECAAEGCEEKNLNQMVDAVAIKMREMIPMYAALARAIKSESPESKKAREGVQQ